MGWRPQIDGHRGREGGPRGDPPGTVRLGQQLPVVQPGQGFVADDAVSKPGVAERAASDVLREVEALPVEFGHREMRELEIALDEARTRLAYREHRRQTLRRQRPLAEKGQLVTVGLAALVAEIAREIPPFRFVIGVDGVVLGESVRPAGQGETPIRWTGGFLLRP